ncbi:MAG: Na(+)-translocating NADH-quinone reductase subunit [Verrucomicrobiota bacterium]|jgi:Na+-transporting NADH:ubiquinone oxidoreductase subunit D
MSAPANDGLFSPANMKTIKDPFIVNNPIAVQVLGICSALAVTTSMKPAIIMAVAVSLVTGFATLAISLMRNWIPGKIRMIVELVVISTLVIIVDQLLKAYAYELSAKLSVFVGLIITNCIVMGRCEAFALNNKPWPSFLDGFCNGAGYGALLIITAVFREILGSGKIFDMHIIPESWYASNGGWYYDNGIMIVPTGAFVVIAVLIWIHREYTKQYDK